MTIEPATAPQAEPLSIGEVFQFVKENIVAISAIALVAGVVWATVFLYGYLKVFDWRLLWIVQYPDILGFALIAVALIGGSATLVAVSIDSLFLSGVMKGSPNWKYIFGWIGTYAVLVAFVLYAEHLSATPHYNHLLYGLAALASGLAFEVVIVSWFYARQWPNLVQLGWASCSAVAFAFVLGSWLGYTVLESSANNVFVVLKDETMEEAKLIMIMSHHTIFYVERKIVIVPTDDVRRITSGSLNLD
jgi:hypothetical protein